MSSSASSGTGGPAGCIELTAAAFNALQFGGTAAAYGATTMPNIAMADPDMLQVEFYGSGAGAGLNGENKGTFNLATGIDSNYSTCARCVRLFEDSADARQFYQQSGTLVVAATSDQLNGTLNGTLTNVTLVEVTIADSTFVSTPVPNGMCLHITSATIAATPPTPPVVPAAWTCDPTYYDDGECDCGCGAFDDLDCANQTLAACK